MVYSPLKGKGKRHFSIPSGLVQKGVLEKSKHHLTINLILYKCIHPQKNIDIFLFLNKSIMLLNLLICNLGYFQSLK